MVMAVDADTQVQQQALLLRLLELTTEQREALDAGDIPALNAQSALRAQLLKAAAPYVPPQRPWTPALAPLAAEVQSAAESLQRDLRAVLEQVQRDLQELNRREHVADYLPGTTSKGRLAWKG